MLTIVFEVKMNDTETLPSSVTAMENSTEESDLNPLDSDPVTLLTLNEDVFQEILSQLSYDEVARLRLVFFNIQYFINVTIKF